MTVELLVQLFFFLKGVYDNYNDNNTATHLLVKRLSGLEDPILKFQSQELSITKDALESLVEVLQGIKQFLD